MADRDRDRDRDGNTGAGSGGGGGPAPASLTFAHKLTGGSETPILDAGSANPGNMAAKQLILVVTSAGAPSELQAVDTTDASLLNEDGDNTGTLAADTPVEIPFDMTAGQLAGVVNVTLTISGVVYTFTFQCYQWSGTLRAVNSAGTSTTGIVVNGVNIGDAATGHVTLNAAHTAATSGDTVVATEAFLDNTGMTATKSLIVDVADAVRHNGTIAANGYRHSNDWAITGAITFIARNVRRLRNGSGQGGTVLRVASSPVLVMERCVFANIGVGIGEFAVGAPRLYVRNCILYPDATNGIGVSAGATAHGGDLQMFCENNTVFGRSASAAFQLSKNAGNSSTVIGHLKNNVALGAFSLGAYDPDAGSGGGGSWHADSDFNVGVDTTAPGANSSDNAVAAAYFKNLTGGSEDAHCVSRAVLDNFPGADLSSSFVKDIDGTIRTDWYAGADWIAP